MKTLQIADRFGFGCSRVVYRGTSDNASPCTSCKSSTPDGKVLLVGRTLDWMNPIPTDVYVYPAGIEKQSMSEGAMYRWKSKYGSVLAVSYDGGATEGMNSEGLVMNGLFCRGTKYPAATPDSDTPVMSLAVIVSFFLDQYTTVDEVYEWFENNKFGINGATFDSGTVATIHFALTDRDGHNLVVEFYDGKVTLYKGDDILVLTNEPSYATHQAVQQYWDAIDGQTMLPGSHSSFDRYIRATYFINHVPKTLPYWQAYAAISSIMGVVTVPFLYENEGKTLSSTQWRSIADLINGRYYFRFADSYADFWVDLNTLNLNEGAPVLKLNCSDHQAYSGCINSSLLPTTPFTPMY